MELIAVLDNIRSVHNVGSIFRTADGAGVKKIYLCGITPSPLDRFKKVRSDFSKVALGAEQSVPWEYALSTKECISDLRRKDFFIVALEQSRVSVALREAVKKVCKHQKVALVVSAEVRGAPPDVLAACDLVAEIPMRGKIVRYVRHPKYCPEQHQGKESLNVSVAFGIAAYFIVSYGTKTKN